MRETRITHKEFDFAADAWQWLDDHDFVQSLENHLFFVRSDDITAEMSIPQSENSNEKTLVKICDLNAQEDSLLDVLGLGSHRKEDPPF